jgi:molybdopterin synthase sulfur carrier subunit
MVNLLCVQYACGAKLDVKVRFFTSLREIVGKREETLTFVDSVKVTVDLVLKTLSKKYGDAFTEYVYDAKTGQPKNFLQFLINGTSTSTLNGLQTELRDGDVLAVLPPVGGG